MKRLDGGVVRIAFGEVSHYDGGALDSFRFEYDSDVLAVERCRVSWNTIVSYHWRRKDEYLSTIRRVGHGFSV